jgi:hypothetical protein
VSIIKENNKKNVALDKYLEKLGKIQYKPCCKCCIDSSSAQKELLPFLVYNCMNIRDYNHCEELIIILTGSSYYGQRSGLIMTNDIQTLLFTIASRLSFLGYITKRAEKMHIKSITTRWILNVKDMTHPPRLFLDLEYSILSSFMSPCIPQKRHVNINVHKQSEYHIFSRKIYIEKFH